MSSPKRAPKPARGGAALKTAAKVGTKSGTKARTESGTNPRGKAARGNSSREEASRDKPDAPASRRLPAAANGMSAEADRLAAALERGLVEGRLDIVSAQALQKLMAVACRLYTARREAGEDIMPVPPRSIAATDVMVTASGLLRAGDLAVFELGMWQNWTGR